MLQAYFCTTTVKASGGARCVYLPSNWGIEPGTRLVMHIWTPSLTMAEALPAVVTARCANSSGSVKVTIPFNIKVGKGDWVHIKLTPAQ